MGTKFALAIEAIKEKKAARNNMISDTLANKLIGQAARKTCMLELWVIRRNPSVVYTDQVAGLESKIP